MSAQKVLLLFVLFTLIISACGTASPEPSPTIPPTNTPTIQASPTESPTLSPTPSLEPTPTLLPTIAPPALEDSGALPTNFFLVNAPQSIATLVSWNLIQGTAYDPNMPPSPNGLPPHLLVTFDNEAVDLAQFNPRERQGRIFPIQSYAAMFASSGLIDIMPTIENLKNILITRPEQIDGGIPVLPGLTAAQSMNAKVKYLSFKGGEGISFLAALAQDISPVTDQNLFYFFQGLSTDGLQYVSFVFPVQSTLLPDTFDQISQDVQTALQTDPIKYFAEITEALNQAQPNEFIPNLNDMEQMVQSMEIVAPSGTATQEASTPTATPPTGGSTSQPTLAPTTAVTLRPLPTATPTAIYADSDLIGITWYWISLAPASGDTVAPGDPDEYYITFKSDGSINAVSDCNSAAGTFTVRRDRLSIDFVSGTDKDCGNNSLSDTFINTLEDALTYEIDGNRLIITLKDGGILRLTK
jgi:hypothetical protein